MAEGSEHPEGPKELGVGIWGRWKAWELSASRLASVFAGEVRHESETLLYIPQKIIQNLLHYPSHHISVSLSHMKFLQCDGIFEKGAGGR